MKAKRLCAAVEELYTLICRLRAPGGCPWDAQQTDASLKMYLLEEAYEVLDAIENSGPAEVCGELGDLLFQIAFLARLAEERGEFDLTEVLERITRKMIHRHPHVFGRAQVESAEEVAQNWARLKAEENSGALGAFETVPADLPGLQRAHRLLERASKLGRDASADDPWTQAEGAFSRLRDALPSGETRRIEEALGGLLFGLAALARSLDMNAENALRLENRRFLEGIKERCERKGREKCGG